MSQYPSWTEAYDAPPVRGLLNILPTDSAPCATAVSFLSMSRSTPEFILPDTDNEDLYDSQRADLEMSFSARSEDKKRRVELKESATPLYPVDVKHVSQSTTTSTLSLLQNALSLSGSTLTEMQMHDAYLHESSPSCGTTEAVHILLNNGSNVSGGEPGETRHPHVLLMPSDCQASTTADDDLYEFAGCYVVEVPLTSPILATPVPPEVKAEGAIEGTQEEHVPSAATLKKRKPITPTTYSTPKCTLLTLGGNWRESERERARVLRGSRLPRSTIAPSHPPPPAPLTDGPSAPAEESEEAVPRSPRAGEDDKVGSNTQPQEPQAQQPEKAKESPQASVKKQKSNGSSLVRAGSVSPVFVRRPKKKKSN